MAGQLDPAQLQALTDELGMIQNKGYGQFKQNFAPSNVPQGVPESMGGGNMPNPQQFAMQNPYGNVGITNNQAMMGNQQFQHGAPQMPGPAQEPGLLQGILGIMALLKAKGESEQAEKGKAEAAKGTHLKEADEEERKRRRQKQIEMDEAMGRNREKAEAQPEPKEEYVPDAMNRMIDRIWEKLG